MANPIAGGSRTAEPGPEPAGPAGPPGRRAAAAGRLRQARSDPGWLLLPLRLFLGVTFTKAGVDKFADRAFFDPAEPTSIAAQIAAFRQTSPLRPLLGIAADHATVVGVLMALGEIAVGVATLLGVRVRLAALGGALISLSLLLTVTWRTRPYYYGSDIVFLASWLPLIGYGSGDVLSLQHATWRRWAAGTEPAGTEPAGTEPAGAEPAGAEPAGGRRALLAQLGAAAVGTLATALGARLARGGPRRAAAEPAGAPPATSPAAGGTARAHVADVPVGQVVPVTMPAGTAAYLVHVTGDRFVAFDRTCTHAGCQVGLTADRRAFACPCHLARYDAATGRVLDGPAPRPLDQIPVRVVGDEVLPAG
jgi:thiosulfate dehydrogenase [quinone] large subunit